LQNLERSTTNKPIELGYSNFLSILIFCFEN